MTTPTRVDRIEKREENMTLFYKRGETYEITINPNDAHQCLGSAQRTEDVYELMYPKFLKFLVGKWELYTELSESTHMNYVGGFPRVHFHGKITLENVTRFKERLYDLAMTSDIKISPYDAHYWDEYMTKSVPQISQDLGKGYASMTSENHLPLAGVIVEPTYDFFRKKRAKPLPQGRRRLKE